MILPNIDRLLPFFCEFKLVEPFYFLMKAVVGILAVTVLALAEQPFVLAETLDCKEGHDFTQMFCKVYETNDNAPHNTCLEFQEKLNERTESELTICEQVKKKAGYKDLCATSLMNDEDFCQKIEKTYGRDATIERMLGGMGYSGELVQNEQGFYIPKELLAPHELEPASRASNWKLVNSQLCRDHREYSFCDTSHLPPHRQPSTQKFGYGLNDHYAMENNDEVAAVGSIVEDNPNESDNMQGNKQMTTNFLMTEGNGLGYASETAIATENDANSEAANMGIKITFGAVFLCTSGISIYLRKIWVKSNENTPLLD